MTKASSNSDQDLIEAIAKLLNEQNLAEIEIEREDLRVRVTRSYATQAVQQVSVPAYAPAAPVAPMAPSVPAGSVTAAAPAHEDLASNPGTLTSPMVGTAYLSPEPGKPQFAPVGSRVTEGQTVLIIEAMKTMNQIPAHRAGIVTRILVEDNSPVEYGQPLVVIGKAMPMFQKVLIANRGEIALRILRACRELGIPTVAVHSTADSNAMHVRFADESVCIGPPPAKDSYLNIPSIMAACEITGADAVHPGYGFLSENARFARILSEHKITFIGPSSHHIEIMGDKITAKKTAVELGIPVVPGSAGEVKTEAEAISTAAEVGYPVLIKATAGGGGRGMKVALTEADVLIAWSTARAEAKAAFGNESVYMEKYLGKPRHIEVQVMGDGQGNAVHLGTRDCSLQRRHQKVWEEAPAPTVPMAKQMEIGEICADAMRKLKYSGAGTIEFLYEDGEFYFIEMNTRLQVEHPVTERITGIDIVYEQIRVASGEKLSLTQDQVTFTGHAIEVRINAEDPQTFAPSPGKIQFYHPAGGVGVRVDSAVYQGYTIPPYYDSLIGKLIVYGRTRAECLQRLRRAVDEFVVDGIKTTLPLFQRLNKEPEILSADYDIHWLEKYLKADEKH